MLMVTASKPKVASRKHDLDEKTIRNSCANAHKKLEAVVEAVYKILKPQFNKNDAQNICLLE